MGRAGAGDEGAGHVVAHVRFVSCRCGQTHAALLEAILRRGGATACRPSLLGRRPSAMGRRSRSGGASEPALRGRSRAGAPQWAAAERLLPLFSRSGGRDERQPRQLPPDRLPARLPLVHDLLYAVGCLRGLFEQLDAVLNTVDMLRQPQQEKRCANAPCEKQRQDDPQHPRAHHALTPDRDTGAAQRSSAALSQRGRARTVLEQSARPAFRVGLHAVVLQSRTRHDESRGDRAAHDGSLRRARIHGLHWLL